MFLLNRASTQAKAALGEIRKSSSKNANSDATHEPAPVFHIDCDLTSFAAVRACADDLKQHDVIKKQGLYALVCNAGVMGLKQEVTVDGFDPQMQVNHLSHFLLTHELWADLKKAAAVFGEARVVQHR